MIERPILFSAPMVRAILAGQKTQTRRAAPIADLNIKPQSSDCVTWGVSFSKPVKGVLGSYSGGRFSDEQARAIIAAQFCPYGVPGDRLWVRESHWYFQDEIDPLIGYTPPLYTIDDVEYRADGESERHGWRPSIHMPRWASRITLNITGVSVERLQDISEVDALAEGIAPQRGGGFGLPAGEHYHALDPRISYWSLWDAINGPGSVEANPWVWCVAFERAPS